MLDFKSPIDVDKTNILLAESMRRSVLAFGTEDGGFSLEGVTYSVLDTVSMDFIFSDEKAFGAIADIMDELISEYDVVVVAG